MRIAHKNVIIGACVILGLGGASAAAAMGGRSADQPTPSPETQLYARYIDAGNLTAPITAGNLTWEPQTGFVGGTPQRVHRASSGRLARSVARTVLAGPSAFSLAVPNGSYRVSLWVARGAQATSITTENGTTTAVDARQAGLNRRATWTRVALPVTVDDGSLDLTFGPAPSTLVVSALAITGRVVVPDPSVTPTAEPSVTVTTPPPTTAPPATPPATVPPTTVPPTTAPPATQPPAPEPSPNRKCTKPVFTTSDTNGGWSTNGYYVHNNMWNASEGGPETLYACAYNNWYVTSTQPDSTSVKTYPNVHKDYDDVPISSFNTLTSTFAATSPHTGIYNVAYDIWLNGVASSGSTEMMIWTENYKQRPAGSIAATADFGGRTYDVWKTSDNQYIAFVPKQVMTSGNLDLLAMFKWTMSKGWLRSNSTVGQIDYGVEICSTNNKPATFEFTDFSITSS